MKRTVTAVLLSFLWPGLGQFYNLEKRKGAVLMLFSALLFLAPLVWIIPQTARLLPDPEKTAVAQENVQEAVMEVVKRDRHLLNLISFTFLGFWAYAITQAYFKAKEIGEKEAENPEE